MTLDEFAETTRRVVERDGFDEYQPTLIFPARRHIMTLAGLPPDIEPESPVLSWASESAQDDEEFLVAFKTDATHFKVIRRTSDGTDTKTYAIVDNSRNA
jgi:hypothetical protein